MTAQVICKSDKDPINADCASVETSFSRYSLWEIFPVLKAKSRVPNTEMNNTIRLEFELIWDLRPVLDTCKFGQDLIKND